MAVRVLIVEDDPAQRRILEEMVRRFGCDPMPVDGGMKALEVLKSQSGGTIELVILDLNMPEMTGLEFLEPLEVLAAIRSTGALEYSRNQARREAQMACAAITVLPASAYKDSLVELASFAAERDH